VPQINTDKDDYFTPIDRVVECTTNVLVSLAGLEAAVDRLAVAVQSLQTAAKGGHE